ncbi:MAG: DUF2911 domain-containing protein [Pedobacter sp.]|nr:MAG: DUF2911 domain-containing protein [Pedobacter sp.]
MIDKKFLLPIMVLLLLLGSYSCQNKNDQANSESNKLNSDIQQSENNNKESMDQICYNPNAKGDTTKRSIKSAVNGKIGPANLSITYHSPGVRNRVIWGGLIPYGEVWVTGAHNATTLETDKPLLLAGKELAAGKYAIFTIPDKEEWTLIINKNWNQHLADDYQESEDVLRLKIKPIANQHTERLQYFIESKDTNAGSIAFAWEKLRFELPVNMVKNNM